MPKLPHIHRHIAFRSEQHRAFVNLLYVSSVAQKHVENILGPFNLSTQQYRVLRALRNQQNEGVRINKLHEFLLDEKSDVSRLVDRMQNSGLVKKLVNPNDRRITYAVITTKGLSLMAQVDKKEDDFYLPLNRISEKQAKQLNGLLQAVLDGFEK